MALNQDNVSEWSFCFIAVTDLNKIFGFTIFRLLAYPQFLVGFVLLLDYLLKKRLKIPKGGNQNP
jgi:hypothetical protein